MPWRKRVVASALALGLAGSASTAARAQSDEDRAAARATATEGARAMDEGRYADAIDLFSRAESLVHAPPHLLYIARAYVKLGKLVKARETYLKITRESWPSTAPRAFLQAQTDAESDLAALEPRIPTVLVRVQGAEKFAVTMDDAPLPKALVGVRHPVDPGAHVFVAKAKGLAAKATKKIDEGTSGEVVLELQSAPGEPGPPDDEVQAGSRVRAADRPSTNAGGTLRVVGITTAGVGAAFLVAGTVFMLKNRSARDDADALCPNGHCPAAQRPQIQSLDSDADSAATASWITYGIGAGALAAGVVMYVLSGKKSEPAVRASVGPGSLGIRGRF